MSTPIEHELKSQLDRVRVQLRPDLARQAHQAFRRQRVRRRLMAGGSTAIVVAAAVSLLATGTVPLYVPFGLGKAGQATSPSLPPGGGIPPAGLAPAPPGDGLSAQQAARDILWMHSAAAPTLPGDASVTNTLMTGGGTALLSAVPAAGALSVGSSMVPGAGSGRYREIHYARDGKPTEDVASSSLPDEGGQERTVTAVLYKDRQWTRDLSWSAGPGGQLAQDACAAMPSLGLSALDFSTDPSIALTLLSCPAVTVTRGVTIDGIGAIALTARKVRGTLWINAATGLPIKSVLPAGVGGWTQTAPPGDAVSKTITTLFGYLAATSANLAYLSASIPAGFHGSTQQTGQIPTGKYTPPWVPPGNVIPPFGLQPVPAGDTLTVAQAGRDVLWTRTTTQATKASDTVVDSMFDYRSASRDLTYTPSGQPWDDDNTYVKPGTAGKSVSVHTVVLYDKRTVSVSTSPAQAMRVQPQDACSTAGTTGLASISFASSPGAARALLSCSGQQVTRGLTLDGVDAIKIAGRDGETLWINATTDLPIEIVIVNSRPYPPAAYNNTPSPGQVIQYSWLPPTATNLSYLGIPTPASFTRTQSPG